MSFLELPQYRGELSAAGIAEGTNLAADNAARLFADAQLLFEHRRYASAAVLAILSIEETGKEGLLLGVAMAATPSELAKAWKKCRTHTAKNVLWNFDLMIKHGARTLDDLFPMIAAGKSDHAVILERMKQIALYTDCLGREEWFLPATSVNEGIASLLLDAAEVLLSDERHSKETIELKMKHLGPVRNAPFEQQKTAVVEYYREAHQLGLFSGSINDVTQLLYGGESGRNGLPDESKP